MSRLKLRLLFTFYKSFCFASILLTFICLFLSWEYGPDIFYMVLLLKAVSLYIIYGFIKRYKASEFFYYQNLGLSKTVLWSLTLAFDLILYLFLLSQLNGFR